MSLAKDERELIPWFPNHIATLELCIDHNSSFFQQVALSVAGEWGADKSSPDSWEPSGVSDYIKVKATLKQLLREWSEEGAKEREQSHGRVLARLEERYPDINTRHTVKILNPGVGLGRLNFELVSRGFTTQGNDFSYFMLFLSNFMLNHAFTAFNFQIFPFIHSSSNQVSRDLQCRPISIPDILPYRELQLFQGRFPDIPVPDLMSITSGSFTDLYGPNNLQISSSYSEDSSAREFRSFNKGNFDVVITMFFLDTASNIIEYVKTVQHCLKGTGEWINFGPLLWHYEDAGDTQRVILEDGSIIEVPINGLELTRDDLWELVQVFFDVELHETVADVKYGSDERALGRWAYDCELWALKQK